MKRCVVTGATGLIGSHLVRDLLQDWEVVALSRSPVPADLRDRGLRHVPVDLSQPWETSVLPDQVDAVIHLAQSEHYREFPNLAESLFSVNTFSTLKLLDYARQHGASSFVLASTGGVYGTGNQPFSEDGPVTTGRQLGFYSDSKLCSELMAHNYRAYFSVMTLRFFFVYGPDQRPTMLIPRLVSSVREGKPIQLQGPDGLRINPIHVEDAVRAIRNALGQTDSHVVNVAGPTVLSLRQIGEQIGQILGRTPQFDVNAAATPGDLIADIARMSSLLWAPQISFEEGVSRFIQHTYPKQLV
jgi:nucleoside-diphosphate-sugar epimerase